MTTAVAAVATAALVAGAGCTGSPSAPRHLQGLVGDGDRLEVTLASAVRPLDSCAELDAEATAAVLEHVGPHGLPYGNRRDVFFAAAGQEAATDGTEVDAMVGSRADAGASTSGRSFSETNNQEAGVDEPDRVKTDGRLLVTLDGVDTLQILDVRSGRLTVVGSLPLVPGQPASSLFLLGDRVLVFGSGSRPDRPRDDTGRLEDGSRVYLPSAIEDSYVASVDISDPTLPRLLSKTWHDGTFVTARLVEGVAHAVFWVGGPRGIDFVMPEPVDGRQVDAAEQQRRNDHATAENRRRVEEAPPESWLPQVAIDDPGRTIEVGHAAGCEDVFAPEQVSGTGMVAVLPIDVRTGKPGGGAVVLGAGQHVYASRSSLYVLTDDWGAVKDRSARPASGPSTAVHQFDISDPGRAEHVASGAVPGTILNQFSLSEHDGVLRVATTLPAVGDDRQSESAVTTLRRRGEVLEQVGQIGGLGRGESIYAVRFIGATGYVVTFRRTDPLYVLDLRDPAAPRLTGELKIPGYSAYLHPMGDGWLIGIGQDATDEGRATGLQLSVFDVRDPGNPRRVHQRALADTRSAAEYDHHAFLHWPATGLTVVPVDSYGAGEFSGAIGFHVDQSAGIDEVGRIRHPAPRSIAHPGFGPAFGRVDRSVVVDERLLTISDAGVLASDLESLEELGWVPFG